MNNNDSLMQGKNFFNSLFDFSFSSFVTLRFIKVLYGIIMALAALAALTLLVAIASRGGVYILLALVVAAVAFLIYVVIYRVLLEFIVVIFRIAENTSIIAKNSNPKQM
ncbi:MAG: hypothetical protein QG671_2365 [Actinomycetota bacterium]|jgi:hypothetical protein|nr:hypothetical protein [Actinomycetota bacterium]MDQ5975873.1 hypothetical protein [Actinomycetota bacterium]